MKNQRAWAEHQVKNSWIKLIQEVTEGVDDIHEVNTETLWSGVSNIYYLLVKNQQAVEGQGWLIYSCPFPRRTLNSNVFKILNSNTGVLIYTLISIYKAITIHFHGIMKVLNGYTH